MKPVQQGDTTHHQRSMKANLLNWLFRIGFGGVFLINAMIALLEPSSFVALMRASFLGRFVNDFTPFIYFIIANDFALGMLLIWNRWRGYVYAWAGSWLLAVSLVKLSELLS